MTRRSSRTRTRRPTGQRRAESRRNEAAPRGFRLRWMGAMAKLEPGGRRYRLYALPTGKAFRGRMNSTAARWQRSELVTRTILARRVLTELFPAARSFRGAEGISKVSRDDCGRFRRVARTAPPALTSTTVVKSRKSFPLSSTPRAKTGIANGSLSQRRLSEGCFRLGTWEITSQGKVMKAL